MITRRLAALATLGLRRAAAALLFAAAVVPAAADDAAARRATGRKLFMQGTVPSCAVCHTLRDAGAEGAVGPVLDELKPDAERVATALRNGVGNMPSFKASLTEEQITTLSRYIAEVTGGGK